MPPNNQVGPTQPTPGATAPGVVGSGSVPTKTPTPTPKNPNSTQNTLQFSEIRDNMIIMKDGSFRAVIACKSINFDLMSSREKEGVEYAYQNFLNSLTHPVQVLIRSQRIDIGPYIDKLAALQRDQDNMLLSVLMDDYINFIDTLSQEANIMDKSFFIVVPYSSVGDLSDFKAQSKGLLAGLFGSKADTVTHISNETFQKAKDEVKKRVEGVTGGLFQMGIQSVQLNTKELGELFYNFYNPDTAVREPLGNFQDITAMYVKKGEAPQASPNGANV